MHKKYYNVIFAIVISLCLVACSTDNSVEVGYTASTFSIATVSSDLATETSETCNGNVVFDENDIRILGGCPSKANVYKVWIYEDESLNERSNIEGIANGILLSNYVVGFYSGNRYSYLDENDYEIFCDVISVEDNLLFIDSMNTIDGSEVFVNSDAVNSYVSYTLPYYQDFNQIMFMNKEDAIYSDLQLECVFVRQTFDDIPVGLPYFYEIDSNFRYYWSESISGIAKSVIAVPLMYYSENSIYVVDDLRYDLEMIESDVSILSYSECIDGVNDSISSLESSNILYSITPYAAELCYVPILSCDSAGAVTNDLGMFEYYLVPCWIVYFQNSISVSSATRFAGAIVVNAANGQMIMENLYE